MKDYPHPLISVIPIVVLIGLLVTVISLFGSDSLTGGSQVALLLGTAVCVTISMTVYRISWHTFEKQIMKTIGNVSITLVILLAVGMVSGSWMISGVVPTLIYHPGCRHPYLSPLLFLQPPQSPDGHLHGRHRLENPESNTSHRIRLIFQNTSPCYTAFGFHSRSSFLPSIFREMWRFTAAQPRAGRAIQRTKRSLTTSFFSLTVFFS